MENSGRSKQHKRLLKKRRCRSLMFQKYFLYWCGTWSLTLMEECGLRVFIYLFMYLIIYSFPIYIPYTLQAGAILDIGRVESKR
jgi:hypothetical protein